MRVVFCVLKYNCVHKNITIYTICILAPDADTSNPYSEFLNQELSKSDRPELASAGVVISGGKMRRPTSFVLHI